MRAAWRPAVFRTLVVAFLLLGSLTALNLEASQAVYTKDNPPETPKLADLPLKNSVSQYGITWTFDKQVPVGRFVNGDHYVVGPVTVVAIDPAPLLGGEVPASEVDESEGVEAGSRIRNGSMLNPPPRQEVAYDSGIRNWFRPALVAVPPIRMSPGNSLVSTISLKQGEENSFPYHGSGRVRGRGDNSPVKSAAVLTCMAEPQPADAFRPSFCDTGNRVYLARNLRRELLRNLPRPENTPDLDTWVRVFQRPWVNTGFFGFDQPMENMPHYGQWVGQAQSMAGLMLMLDFPPEQRERLLINMIQVGIDYWGVVRGGHPGWQGWGGHGSGRKFPIVFAGLLFGDEQMAAPTRMFPNANFGEDNQTVYGDCWTGARVCFAGHSGVHHGTGEIPRAQWGPYEHLPPSEWDKNGMRNAQSEAYRRANSSSSWPGQALVIRMLHGEEYWGHDAFFDYVDRWMFEVDKEFRDEIGKHWPRLPVADSQRWAQQGQAWEGFVTGMWEKYRPTLDAPTDGWKKGKE